MIYWGSELTHTSYLFWNYFSDVSVLGKKKKKKNPTCVCTAGSILLLRHICSTLKCLSYGCTHQIYYNTENLSKYPVFFNR